MLTLYRETIVPQLTKEFDYGNTMEVPRVAKVIVNVGIGEAKDNDKALDAAVGDVVTITGQKPALIKARKSVAAFKLRAGQTVDILLAVTNPGLWMAHCHIAEHAESGMMFSFKVHPSPPRTL